MVDMNNKRWHKVLAITLAIAILAGSPGIASYAEEIQKGGSTEVEETENVEAVDENNLSAPSDTVQENVDNSSSSSSEKDVSENEGNTSDSDMNADSDLLTPEEAEKNDMANSWRFKDGERIITDSASQNARSARAITPWTNINGVFYNTRGEVINGVVAKGIDVSQWNGNINWATVKGTDVDYAIIRCGYGMDQSNQDDTKWKRNADACTQYDIPFGAYLYSYADSVERARSEAQHVLRLVKGYKLTYPIYYDLEEASVRASVSRSEIAQIAKAFCDTIEAAGYRVSIYANTDWFTNYLTDPMFNNWNKWVAQYNYRCTYTGAYTMWQCTSAGSVSGISGAVDLNMDFGTVDNKRLVVKDGKTYCYSGSTQLFGEQKVNGSWYYFDESNGGAMKTGWHDFENKRVYYRDNGTMVYGEQRINEKWYYFNTVTGAMQTGFYQLPTKKVYYCEEGYMLYGEQQINGKWYYFDTYDGAMKTGFYKNEEKNITVYYGIDGAMLYGEQRIAGKWYYFDTYDGAMKTGFYKNEEKDKLVYYGIDGAMLYGKQQIAGKWYYFDTYTGNMFTGEQRIDGKWYYFDEKTGVMQTGFYDFPDKTVYYGADGAMLYGEQRINGKWYYFDTYYGSMQTGFYQLPTKKVYYCEDGYMLYGEQEIGGKWYAFDNITGEMYRNRYYGSHYYGSDGVRVS